MRDEPYDPAQLPAYGSDHRPAQEARVTAPLRYARVGTVFAVVATAAAVVALVRYPIFSGSGPWWTGGLVAATAGLLACCGAQWWAWRTAASSWSARPGSAPLARLSSVSWVVHVIAYACTALAWVCGALGLFDAGGSEAAIGIIVALVCSLVALLAAGLQYVRASGAPGTVPAHMHRLVARNRP